MRKILISALLLATVASPVLAQTTYQLGPNGIQQVDPRQNDQRDQQRDAQRDAQRDPQRDAQRDAQRDPQRDAQRDAQADSERRAQYQAQRDRNEDNRNYNDGNYNQGRDEQRVYGYSNANKQRDWRYEGNRYQIGAYSKPYGYTERTWVSGVYLPRTYRDSSRYWITNPTQYRLSPAWTGTRWIRVGNDALLVTTANGVIASSVRGLFY